MDLLLDPVDEAEHVHLLRDVHLAVRPHQGPRLVIIVLHHAENGDPGEFRVLQRLRHHAHVARASVQQDEIRLRGHSGALLAHVSEPPRQRLPHGGVVVRSVGGSDLKSSVFALCQLAVQRRHHSCGNVLRTQIRYVVRLDPLGKDLQRQKSRQLRQHLLGRHFLRYFGFRMRSRVAYHHVAEVFRRAALGRFHRDTVAALLQEEPLQLIRVLTGQLE